MKLETQIIIELQDLNETLKEIANSIKEINERDKLSKGAKK